MESIWQKTTQIGGRSPLEGDIAAEIAVIGGGLTGILTAHYLAGAGRDVVVLEAGRIGSGQTGRTSAKISAQHGLRYAELIHDHGVEAAKSYAAAQFQAVALYRRLIDSLAIQCDLEDAPAYLYTCLETGALEEEFQAYQTLGLGGELTSRTELPFPIVSALRLDGQAQFHPLKFLRRIAAPLRIYEHTRVLGVRDGVLTTGSRTREEDRVCLPFPLPEPPRLLFYADASGKKLLHRGRKCAGDAGHVPRRRPGRPFVPLGGRLPDHRRRRAPYRGKPAGRQV